MSNSNLRRYVPEADIINERQTYMVGGDTDNNGEIGLTLIMQKLHVIPYAAQN